MSTKLYTCLCGKTFTTSQSFNGHKTHCKIHQLNKYGTLDIYNKGRKLSGVNSGKSLHKNSVHNKKLILNKWVSEQHRCERCGKIMTEYYGSGRFCSRACANSRNHSEETKDKISKTLIKTNNPDFSPDEVEQYKQKLRVSNNQKQVYHGLELPEVEKVSQKYAGYPNRKNTPYSERFWAKVLDNNNISYKQNVSVWKPGPNNYYLDFLIDDLIDLEIDGSMHEHSDVKTKDKIRNQYLFDKGYIVYRIKWVNPINDSNKIIVNKQIDELLKFLHRKRIN